MHQVLGPNILSAFICRSINNIFRQRLNADEALNHDFFWTYPLPSESLKCLETLKEHKLIYLQEKNQKLKVSNCFIMFYNCFVKFDLVYNDDVYTVKV